MTSRLPYAVAGLLATAAGMAAGHLTAAALDPASSPVLVVGATVIDLTPTPVKEWAVRELGNADKPVLLGSVVAVTLVLAAAAGLMARRSVRLAVGSLLGLVAVAAAMALLRPFATIGDVVPALVAAVAGVAALLVLTGALGPRSSAQVDASSTARRTRLSGILGGTRSGGTRRAETRRADTGRRGFLIAAGVVGGLAVAAAAGGQWVARVRTRIENVVLPRPRDPRPPLPAGLEEQYRGITPFRTPNDRFYRVDTRLSLPVIDLDDWRLTIDGDVDRSFSLRFDELLDLPMVERDITLTCVSNEVGGRYVGGARWLGVPLADLLDRAGVGRGADQLLSTDVDGFTISTPLEVALDGRDTLVAVGMNGDQLPLEHGFPVRLVTPGIYGFVGATKWLTRLTVTTYADRTAYWTKRGWATDAPIKVSSRIDTPQPLATIDAGQTVIGGVAWAQHRGIEAVEVRIDGGPWQRAELGPDAGVDYWRQWYLPWDATPGRHQLASRAITRDGDVQTAVRATPFPAGSSGIQEIVVSVS